MRKNLYFWYVFVYLTAGRDKIVVICNPISIKISHHSVFLHISRFYSLSKKHNFPTPCPVDHGCQW